jgi:hypothetical protein
MSSESLLKRNLLDRKPKTNNNASTTLLCRTQVSKAKSYAIDDRVDRHYMSIDRAAIPFARAIRPNHRRERLVERPDLLASCIRLEVLQHQPSNHQSRHTAIFTFLRGIHCNAKNSFHYDDDDDDDDVAVTEVANKQPQARE